MGKKKKVIVNEINHTADYGVVVYAQTLNLLFEKMGQILCSLLVDLKTIKPIISRRISIKGANLEELMMEYLSEILYLFETKALIFKKFKCNVKDNQLNAILSGEKFNEKKHNRKLSVKAVTYHEFYLREKDKGFETKVIFDV